MIPPEQKRTGAALVIVLAILVLVLALAIGFLSRVTTERSSSVGYASSVNARILGDTAVQLVQAQINTATTQGTGVAWSSQAGLIRTYGSNGAPLKSYKLYSDAQMMVAGALDPAEAAAAVTDWNLSPALFTDLNLPADTDLDGTPDKWPIVDPAAEGTVEGFSIKAGAPVGSYLGVTNPVPMPVRWIYVLRDGTAVAPVGTGLEVTVPGATQNNPVVGRVAFWTDDETCKVNLNTAGEGTYWDIPRANIKAEEDFGEFQPSRNEFQRYPGHPATTCLSAIFPTFDREDLLALAPRIQEGGSAGASVSVNDADPVSLDQDRLYSTEDELQFDSNRSANTGIDRSRVDMARFFLSTTSRAPETNPFNLPKIACWPLHATDSPDYRTANDRMIAFCSTIKGKPYYFQRTNAGSTTDDYQQIPRNQVLYRYLRELTSRPVPGFGGSLLGKYPGGPGASSDRDQILTEIFDYIRGTNLVDGNLAADKRYAAGVAVNGVTGGPFGYGQVTPIVIQDPSDPKGAIDTRGFGRIPTITEVGLWLICTGDAKDTESNDPSKNKTLYPADATGALTSDDAAKTKQLRVEAALILEPFIPSEGYRGIQPDIEITVSGLEDWTIQGNAADTAKNLGFPSLARQTDTDAGRYRLSINPLATADDQRPIAGHIGIYSTLDERGIRTRNNGRLPEDEAFGEPYKGKGTVLNQQYPFVGEPVTVNVNTTNKESPGVILVTKPLQIQVIHRPTGEVLQRYTVNFPGGAMPAPTLRSVNPKKPILPTLQSSGYGNGIGGRFSNMGGFVFQEYDSASRLSDVVRTVIPTYMKNGATQTADPRLLAMNPAPDVTDFSRHPLWDETAPQYRVVNSFVQQGTGWYWHFCRRLPENNDAVAKMGRSLANIPDLYHQQSHPDTSWPVLDAQATGDWDNGIVGSVDGGYLNKPDEGVTWSKEGTRIPYFGSSMKEDFDAAGFFSPNRIMPSPGMFGSLPTGVARKRHWQTLLFRRQPGHPAHPGGAGSFVSDPDYLFLDFFWMPVVEPYAISEPLSTAGKVNLNQQIIPFTWINRQTALHAVLKNEKVISIPNGDAGVYKTGGAASETYRKNINLEATLKQLDFRFENSDETNLFAFRTPSEICDMHIVPEDAGISTGSKKEMDSGMALYWAGHALTGDNSRERIYTTVYPRLTTRSNTYTVYFRAQALKTNPRNGTYDQWNETRDVITADSRGSVTLERYIDPADSALADYAAEPDADPTLDLRYRWRVRNQRQFAP